jgi:hypothetical protein
MPQTVAVDRVVRRDPTRPGFDGNAEDAGTGVEGRQCGRDANATYELATVQSGTVGTIRLSFGGHPADLLRAGDTFAPCGDQAASSRATREYVA